MVELYSQLPLLLGHWPFSKRTMHAMLYKSGHDSAHCEDNHIHLMDFLDLKMQQNLLLAFLSFKQDLYLVWKTGLSFPKQWKEKYIYVVGIKVYLGVEYKGLKGSL